MFNKQNTLDERERQEFFQEIHDLWIKPKFDLWFVEEGRPEESQVWDCLIRLPDDHLPTVELNEEVYWSWFREYLILTEGRTLADIGNQPIDIHDILGIRHVAPPTIDGNPIAFAYLYWNGFAYQLCFDLRVEQDEITPFHEQFKFDGRVIARHLQNVLIEKSVRWASMNKSKLRAIGLWSATALLPYPITKIVERIDANRNEEARKVLVDYCDNEFLDKRIIQTWFPVEAFKERKEFFGKLFSVMNTNAIAQAYPP